MIIDFHFNTISYAALFICFITALYIVLCGLKPMRKMVRHFKRITSTENEEHKTSVKASVIVYTRNDEQYISSYIDDIMRQKGVDFEVIVVNDASADHTADIVKSLSNNYENLYMTFVPEDARSISRRKLSLTLGMKAAKNDVVVTTVANSKIPSDYWLYNIIRHFEDKNIEITLGYSHVDKSSQKGIGKWYRSFDTVTTASLWLGYAICHRPYRGDGQNLAFRREKFFEQNGYALTTYLQYGDDDLFINQFASDKNTAVEIGHESQLIIEWGESEPRLWLDRKEHYSFTAKFLKTKAFVNQQLQHIAQWLMILITIALCFFTMPNFAPSLVLSIMFIVLWGYQIYLYRNAAKVLQNIRLWWSVPIFFIMQPLINSFYRFKFRKRRSSNFTHL